MAGLVRIEMLRCPHAHTCMHARMHYPPTHLSSHQDTIRRKTPLECLISSSLLIDSIYSLAQDHSAVDVNAIYIYIYIYIYI